MNAPARLPGIEGAILDVLQDPIAALCLARQIERDEGAGTATHLQEAAIRVIVGEAKTQEETYVLEAV